MLFNICRFSKSLNFSAISQYPPTLVFYFFIFWYWKFLVTYENIHIDLIALDYTFLGPF